MDKLGELIPNLFYDLIARICPGSLFSAVLLLDPRSQALTLNQLQPAILTLLFFIISYVVGFLLDICSESISYGLNIAISKSFYRYANKDVWALDVWEVMTKHGYHEDSSYVLFLRKCIAELALFRSLCLAWLLFLALDVSVLNGVDFLYKLFTLAILVFAIFRRELSVRRVAQRFLDSKNDSSKNYMIGKFR